MKSNKGITLMSLTVYIIVMLMVVGVISTISSFFYTNVVSLRYNGDNAQEYSNFNMFFLEETKTHGNKVLEINNESENPKYIVFSTGNKYTYQDNAIYKNSARICENVTNFDIKQTNAYGNNIIEVLIEIGNENSYIKNTEYVLAN